MYGFRDLEFDRQNLFFILDHLLPFYLPNNPEKQNFEKMKKTPGDIIILHKYTKNHDHMLYFPCNTTRDRCNYFSFWAFFALLPLWQPKKSKFSKRKKKMKKTLEYIIILHMCTNNYDHMMYGSWDMVPEMGRIDGQTDKKSDIEVATPPKNISIFVINSATISNLLLMELRFKWSTIKVLKCSKRFILILRRSFSKILEDSDMSREFCCEILKKDNPACSQSYPNQPFKLNYSKNI